MDMSWGRSPARNVAWLSRSPSAYNDVEEETDVREGVASSMVESGTSGSWIRYWHFRGFSANGEVITSEDLWINEVGGVGEAMDGRRSASSCPCNNGRVIITNPPFLQSSTIYFPQLFSHPSVPPDPSGAWGKVSNSMLVVSFVDILLIICFNSPPEDLDWFLCIFVATREEPVHLWTRGKPIINLWNSLEIFV